MSEIILGLRKGFSSLSRRACEELTAHMEAPRVILDREGLSKYLSRWYLVGRRNDDEGAGTRESAVNFFLHCLHRGDSDLALHNHPWKWALSFILAGGYWEERRVGDSVVRRRFLPFSINLIRDSDYHRLDLIEKDAWTFLIVGPKVGTWYFWDRNTKVQTRWNDYIRILRATK